MKSLFLSLWQLIENSFCIWLQIISWYLLLSQWPALVNISGYWVVTSLFFWGTLENSRVLVEQQGCCRWTWKITVLWFGLDNNDCCFFHFCIVWRFLLRTEAGSPKISLQRRQKRRSPKALCLLRKISVNLRGNTLGSHNHCDRDFCSSSLYAASLVWLTGLGISLACLRWHVGDVPLPASASVSDLQSSSASGQILLLAS